MKTSPDPQLSSELQEMYLENKEWISRLAFLEDELRFFSKIFNSEIFSGNSNEDKGKISTSLTNLKQRIFLMEKLTSKQQHLLEAILSNQQQSIGLELIEQNVAIEKDIKLLLDSDRLIKKELFALAEGRQR